MRGLCVRAGSPVLPLCLLFLACRCALPARAETLLERAADRILRHQARDGAITMEPASWPVTHVVPYFSNRAAIGLVCAYRQTRKAAYRDALYRWIAWYEAHLNADGTVYDYSSASGGWQSNRDGDSTDSYAATYLDLVLAAYRATRDDGWLRGRQSSLRRVLAAIRSTRQPNGLSIAKPTYPVMYTMDNVEVWRGLRAAAEVADRLGDRQEGTDLASDGRATEAAIARLLWDPARQCYRVGIQTDGGKMEGLSKLYPDVLANLMAVAWLPASDRNRGLFRRLKDRFGSQIPASVQAPDDSDWLVWWGLAARGAGDKEFEATMKQRLLASGDFLSRITNPASFGLICAFLAPVSAP